MSNFDQSRNESGGTGLFSLVKIATYNVNGVNGRLSVLLRWLAKAEPDIVCLQELKAPDERFPEVPIRELAMMRSGTDRRVGTGSPF